MPKDELGLNSIDRPAAPVADDVWDYQPLALLVGRPDEGLEPLAERMEAGGWEVAFCAGPEHASCPLIGGGSCVLRDDAEVTVVFMDPRPRSAVEHARPRVMCAAHGETPAVLALEGRIDPVGSTGFYSILGALRGPQAIVDAVDDLTHVELEP